MKQQRTFGKLKSITKTQNELQHTLDSVVLTKNVGVGDVRKNFRKHVSLFRLHLGGLHLKGCVS